MFDPSPLLRPLVGGLAIGVAASLLWVGLGRIAGITGILADMLRGGLGADESWKRSFLGGMLGVSALIAVVTPQWLASTPVTSPAGVVAAGLLVGFGTRLANGCTSGHGVCGVARGSRRSWVATVVFIGSGVATVAVLRLVGAA